mmetsp:Transcript_20897/g.48017  ORF Transcript_20897/g.48017 Transcript_20897/m.48017 type:complete len:333 (+) Transcript_20897:442-1440(+)
MSCHCEGTAAPRSPTQQTHLPCGASIATQTISLGCSHRAQVDMQQNSAVSLALPPAVAPLWTPMLYTRWTLDLACTVAMILCCRSSSRLEHLPTPPLACHSRADPAGKRGEHHLGQYSQAYSHYQSTHHHSHLSASNRTNLRPPGPWGGLNPHRCWCKLYTHQCRTSRPCKISLNSVQNWVPAPMASSHLPFAPHHRERDHCIWHPAEKRSDRHLCYQYSRHYPHRHESTQLGYYSSRHHPHLPASNPCPPCLRLQGLFQLGTRQEYLLVGSYNEAAQLAADLRCCHSPIVLPSRRPLVAAPHSRGNAHRNLMRAHPIKSILMSHYSRRGSL